MLSTGAGRRPTHLGQPTFSGGAPRIVFTQLHNTFGVGSKLNRQDFGFRAWLGDLGTQLGRKRLNVIVPSLKTRFGAPEPLVIWAQLHAAGSNLAVCLRAGPELLGTVA